MGASAYWRTFNIFEAILAKHKQFCEIFANILSSWLPLRMIIGLAHFKSCWILQRPLIIVSVIIDIFTWQQKCGSGSRAVGSVFFWTSRIRHYCTDPPDPDLGLDPNPSINKQNKKEKPWFLLFLLLLFDFISLETDVKYVPSKGR